MKKICRRALLIGLLAGCSAAQGAALGVFSERTYTTDKLLVKFIDVQGGHLFPQDWLKSVLAEYTGRKLSKRDIARLQQRLTKYYVDAGYVTSGVVVPEQEVTDGVLVLQVVHGRISDLEQSGSWELSPAYVQEYFLPAMTVPVNVQALNEALSQLQEHELVDKVSAKLVPGQRLGEASLDIELTERRVDFYGVTLDNYQSPSVGAARLGLRAGHRSLFGLRDRVELGAGVSAGLKDYSLSYRLPLTVRDLSLQARLQGSEYSVVEEPFDKANLHSSSRLTQVGLNWPVLRRYEQRGELFMAVEQSRITLSLLDVYEQEMDIGALQAGIAWQWRKPAKAFGVRLQAEQGLEALGATRDVSVADGLYRLASMQLNYLWRAAPQQALQWRLRGQWVNEAVPSAKRFALGGIDSVRGYRQNRFVRDYGVASSAEWHWRLNSGLSLYPFADYAWGGSADGGQMTPADQQLYSVGAGLRWQRKGFSANLQWGRGLVTVDSVGSDPQDKGLYLGLSYLTP